MSFMYKRNIKGLSTAPCGTTSLLCLQMIFRLSLDSVGGQWTTWWRHQMETFSALLDLCAGKSPVPGEFPA